MRRTLRLVCPVLASANVLSAGVILAQVVGQPGFLRLPGTRLLFAGCLLALAVYAAIACAVGRWRGALESRELRFAIYAGVGGALWMCGQLLLERFVSLSPRWNGPVVLLAMLVMFSIWGSVGFMARRAGLRAVPSLGLAAWSAVITMGLGVCFGLLLELYVAPVALDSIRSWPEFQRSGWGDVAAFALANTMESAISHLVAGPVVALSFGALGIAMASARGHRLQRLITGR